MHVSFGILVKVMSFLFIRVTICPILYVNKLCQISGFWLYFPIVFILAEGND